METLRAKIASLEAELKDVNDRFSCVLYHATGGAMSKTNYSWEDMKPMIDDFIQTERDEAFQEGRYAMKDEIETYAYMECQI